MRGGTGGKSFGVRGLLAGAVIFSVFVNLLLLTGPLFMLQIYDRVLASRSVETLVTLFALVVGLFAVYGVLEFARSRVLARVGLRLADRHQGPVLAAAVARSAGDGGATHVRAAQAGLDAVRAAFSAPAALALFDIPWTPIFLAALFLFHPLLGWLGLAGAGALILIALTNQILSTLGARATTEARRATDKLAASTDAAASVVHAQGMTQATGARLDGLVRRRLLRDVRAADLTSALLSLSKALRLLMQSAMLALGAWLVLRGELTPGAMIAGSILLGRALAPVEQAIAGWVQLSAGLQAWRALPRALADDTRAPRTHLPDPVARIAAQDIAVLGRGRPVLRGVGLEVAPGEALGVIGPSGSGKTTLARALVGLTPLASGSIRLGGATLDQYDPERLGQLIGYLPQDVRFLAGSVAENIARMADPPDSTRVVAAAQAAGVHEVIEALPEGYDTPLETGGPVLSGGQAQRLALARALYPDPVLLVLDEPNSALDHDGAEALGAVIEGLKARDRAVIIMTHRPAAIAACSRLLVLSDGRVTAQGPRDEVLAGVLQNPAQVVRAVSRAAAP